MKHDNSGTCPHCLEILNTFAGIDEDLRDWFLEAQKKNPAFHVAEAGRGKAAQEADLAKGASRAHFGQSAHNFNCAIDTFFNINGQYRLDQALYESVVMDLPPFIDWYGAPHAPFYERPHFEKRGWKELAAHGLVHLVE